MTVRLPLLLLASVAFAAVAGCVQEGEPERPDDLVVRFCLLAINPEPQGPETVLNLGFERFQQLAPRLAAQLEADADRTGPVHDLGGECDDGFGLEAGNLVNEFEASTARYGEGAGGDRVGFFNIRMPGGEEVLTRLDAERIIRLGWDERAAAGDGGGDISST